jgi:outer membrane protein, heavy metal efflux system
MTRYRNSRDWVFGIRAATVALALAVILVARGTAAQAAHAHVPVEIDATLDWPTLIATTLAAHPGSGELATHAVEAEAWEQRGQQWLAAAPALYFSYLSDNPFDDLGQREYEGGVELPLWRAGQRDAVQAIAASAAATSAAAAAALRLEVTGLLRGTLWDIEAAANDLAAARDAEAAAAELVRVVEMRNERGDLPRGDLLLARSTLLERRQNVVAAEAASVDSERAYRSLTNLDRRPAQFAEQRSEHDELVPSHPLLALAEAAIVRARADLALVDRETRGNPTVTVGPRRESAPLGNVPNDSLALAVRVPVGGKDHGVTQSARATRLVAAAETERGQLLRRLNLDLHEAEHTLVVLEQTAVLAAERSELTEQQVRMAQSAFAQGEIELRELLRLQEAALGARRDMQRLAIEEQRTIAALNQALGETP